MFGSKQPRIDVAHPVLLQMLAQLQQETSNPQHNRCIFPSTSHSTSGHIICQTKSVRRFYNLIQDEFVDFSILLQGQKESVSRFYNLVQDEFVDFSVLLKGQKGDGVCPDGRPVWAAKPGAGPSVQTAIYKKEGSLKHFYV